MSRFDDLVPAHIRALTSYRPGKPIREAERESGLPCVKMASNENPLGPSPAAIEAMRAAAAETNYYPDNEAARLRERLAELNRAGSEHILITAGSTVLLDLLARTLLGPSTNAVTSELSFIVYTHVTQAAGSKLIRVPMRNWTFDLDAVAGAINADTRLVFLANPNNPTGTMFDAAATDAFLARVPAHVVVVLDEAYCDYAGDYARTQGIEYSHSLDYVRQGRNVVVLRTFSKAHGLAGLRVGYGFGPPELMQYLSRVRNPFSVSAVAEAGALAALDDEFHIRRAVENNRTGVAWLTSQLNELGLRPVPTASNFIFCKVGEDAGELAKRLQGEGVIVRPMTAWGAPTAIRVTVGTPETNQLFMAALKKSLARVPAR
ncbi:MAG: histidinol-phosphate transaminase [Acidobacteria bacterium]|nr:histidinol-phosphate transaminase [Acidobacteriota bacterium]